MNNIEVLVHNSCCGELLSALSIYTTKILKPNISQGTNTLSLLDFDSKNVKYVIKWNYDLLGGTITIPKNCILEFDGGSISNGTIIGQDTLVINVGNVDIWEEDLEREGTWREHSGSGGGIPDKPYDPDNHSGLGRKTLELKLDGSNIITQEDFDQDNTVYVITYDFDLNGEEIEIPDGCILEFDGGSFNNGTVTCNNTRLVGNKNGNTEFTGTFIDERLDTIKDEIGGLQGDIDALQEAVGTGGSIDARIAAETSRATTAEINLDTAKANKATTLAGYGITDAYTNSEADAIVAASAAAITGGSTKTIKNVDDYVTTVNGKIDTLKGGSDTTIPAINAAIASEVSRATTAEGLLQEQYNALTQSDKIIGPLPASGHKDVIYRVPDTNSYSDYMYANEGDTTPVLMATYNNAIDGVPTPESTNITSSGGTAKKISETTRTVWLRNGSSGNLDNPNIVCSSFIPTNGKHRFKIVITRPNVSGYRYRVGYCLTESVNDLYKTLDIFHLNGYIAHDDTLADTSLCADHIINFGYSNRPVGVSCQIDEVSIEDSSIVNPLRISDFDGYNVSIVEYQDDKLYVYTDVIGDGLVVEEVLDNPVNASVYIHNLKLITRSKYDGLIRTFQNNAEFANELGVSLVMSPTGAQNCIELPSSYCIVLDRLDAKYKIKHRFDVSATDTIIMGCADGKLISLIDGLATSVLYKHNHVTDERLDVAESEITALKTINSFTSIFRNGSAGNPANTKVVTSAFINCAKGSVKINVTRPNTNGYRYLYGYTLTSSIEDVGTTRSISQMAGYLSHADSDIESPSCDKDIIDILSNACVGIAIQIREVLIEDYEAYKRGDILAEDVRYNMSFYTSEFKNYFISLEKVNEDDVEVDLTKAEEFNLLFKNAYGDVEPFIFFSDPHYCQTYDDASFIPSAKQNINNILSHYKNTATNFVLCGGDWLTDHKQSIAVKTLARIDGLMNKTFDKYYPVFGNHDNNYQGELDTTDDHSANDGGLTNQQMVNLWFRKYGKMYYSFNGTSTKFYVFDTGIDWVTDMNEYRWEQVDWFANQLLNNNDSNIVIVMHIISNNGADFANITPMSTNITAVAQAFNNRTSITMNGHIYNFSGKTGKVKCALCGHTHYDYITTLNSIPVYCITTAMDGTFDLVLLDYAANKLKAVRVGSGVNREMNLV